MRRALIFLLTVFFSATLVAQDKKPVPNLTDSVILKALAQKNKPYRYSSKSLNAFDCSGFIIFVFSDFFADLPSSSAGFKNFGTEVSFTDLAPGDLLLFATGRNKHIISHIALYLGQNTLIHSVSEGPKTGVILSDIDEPYWRNQFVTARRPPFPEGFPMEQADKIYSLEYISSFYKGTLKKAQPEGRGFFFYKNGDSFIGEFKEGQANGYGVYHWKNGQSTIGTFKQGLLVEKETYLMAGLAPNDKNKEAIVQTTLFLSQTGMSGKN